MSPIEPGAKSIDARNEADDWNIALLRNSGRPSGALVYEPKSGSDVLADEQFLKLKNALDASYSGSRNAGRPLLLDGGLSWQEMSMSPRDMDFLNTKNTSSRDIALAFGVPPQLLGIPGDSTFSNFREARLSMWEETIIPLIYHVRDELNNWLVPQFTGRTNQSIEVDAILDDVAALSLRSERRWERVSAATFMTINEKRTAVGLAEIEGGDALLVPSSVLPLEDVTGEADDSEESRAATDELIELTYGKNNQPGDSADEAERMARAESDAPNIRAVAGE
jgi:HK97 family phage portal protein